MEHIAIAVSLAANILLIWLLIKARRRIRAPGDAGRDEQDFLMGALSNLRELVSESENRSILEDRWTTRLCSLFQNDFKASGCLIFRALTDDKKSHHYELLRGSGRCSDWESPDGAGAYSFESKISKHFFWSSAPQVMADTMLGESLPEDRRDQFSSAIAAPLKIHGHKAFIMILRGQDQPPFTAAEAKDFETCFRIAQAGFEIISYARENEQLAEDIGKAHEEGMLQISTGIIHNIGNGLTVLKIALEHLKEVSSIIELSNFLRQEILPSMEKDIKAKEPDPASKTFKYIKAINDIAEQCGKIAAEHETELKGISAKFQNVIEIISLQQQFIGELGTENVVSVNSLMNDVVKMCEHPVGENNIELRQDIKADGKFLVDPALFRHIMLALCKYSIDSINKLHHAKAVLEISARIADEKITDEETKKEIERKMVAIEVRNNGYGVEFSPEAKLPPHSAERQQQRELLFCKTKIEKYGGAFRVDSRIGFGSSFHVSIPLYTG